MIRKTKRTIKTKYRKKNFRSRKYKNKSRTRKHKKQNKRLKSRNSRKSGGVTNRPKRATVKTSNQKLNDEGEKRQQKYDDSIKASTKKRKETIEKKRKETNKIYNKSDYDHRKIFIERAKRMAHVRHIKTPEEKEKLNEFVKKFKSQYLNVNQRDIYDIVKINMNLQKNGALPIGTTNEQLKRYIKSQLRLNSTWKNEVDNEYFNEYLDFLMEQYKENNKFPDPINVEEAEQALKSFEIDDFLEQYG